MHVFMCPALAVAFGFLSNARACIIFMQMHVRGADVLGHTPSLPKSKTIYTHMSEPQSAKKMPFRFSHLGREMGLTSLEWSEDGYWITNVYDIEKDEDGNNVRYIIPHTEEEMTAHEETFKWSMKTMLRYTDPAWFLPTNRSSDSGHAWAISHNLKMRSPSMTKAEDKYTMGFYEPGLMGHVLSVNEEKYAAQGQGFATLGMIDECEVATMFAVQEWFKVWITRIVPEKRIYDDDKLSKAKRAMTNIKESMAEELTFNALVLPKAPDGTAAHLDGKKDKEGKPYPSRRFLLFDRRGHPQTVEERTSARVCGIAFVRYNLNLGNPKKPPPMVQLIQPNPLDPEGNPVPEMGTMKDVKSGMAMVADIKMGWTYRIAETCGFTQYMNRIRVWPNTVSAISWREGKWVGADDTHVVIKEVGKITETNVTNAALEGAPVCVATLSNTEGVAGTRAMVFGDITQPEEWPVVLRGSFPKQGEHKGVLTYWLDMPNAKDRKGIEAVNAAYEECPIKGMKMKKGGGGPPKPLKYHSFLTLPKNEEQEVRMNLKAAVVSKIEVQNGPKKETRTQQTCAFYRYKGRREGATDEQVRNDPLTFLDVEEGSWQEAKQLNTRMVALCRLKPTYVSGVGKYGSGVSAVQVIYIPGEGTDEDGEDGGECAPNGMDDDLFGEGGGGFGDYVAPTTAEEDKKEEPQEVAESEVAASTDDGKKEEEKDAAPASPPEEEKKKEKKEEEDVFGGGDEPVDDFIF
jgi:hypothetical protein